MSTHHKDDPVGHKAIPRADQTAGDVMRAVAAHSGCSAESAPTNRAIHDAIATSLQRNGLTHSGIQEAVQAVQDLYKAVPQAARERSWTGPGHLEDTGYIDKQERCPTCERTDRQYKLGRERGHHGLCRDPWHADDHLRSSPLTRPHRETP